LVAAGAGVLVAAGAGVLVAAGGKVGVSTGLWKIAEDDEGPAETGKTAMMLSASNIAMRITRGTIFMKLQPPSTDSHEGGSATAASTSYDRLKEYTILSRRR
jgi:hypothetical protein